MFQILLHQLIQQFKINYNNNTNPPSDDYESSATINYIEYTYPTAPTFPDIIY